MNLKIAAIATAGAIIATSAQAAPISVELWDVFGEYETVCGCVPNPPTAAQATGRPGGGTNAMLSGPNYLANAATIMASNPADAVFSIDSAALAAGYENGGMTGVAGDSQTISSFFGLPAWNFGFVGNNSMLGTIVRLTGVVAFAGNQDFSVRSDDGYQVTIGGTTYAEVAGLQAPTLTSHAYTGGATPSALFEMVWFETQLTQAALQVQNLDFVPVPLPAGLPLLLGGLGAMGALRLRRKAA